MKKMNKVEKCGQDTKPILSVAVACYNVEKYIDKCLTSFSDERFGGRVQVIVVNDGSSDRTLEIAKSYMANYPDVFEIVDKENGGHGSAVNAAIDRARGKYFRIVDGDDWVNTENLVNLLSFMESATADIVVDNKCEVNMETGKVEHFPMPSDVKPEVTYEFSDICNYDTVTPNIMIHTMSIKTEILKNNNIHLLEGIFYVDIEFIIKSSIRAKTLVFKDIEIYNYLVGNVNQSVNYRNYVKRYSHHLKVTNELIKFATEYECEGDIRNYLDRRIQLLINTHMNIALIFNEDRKLGVKQVKEFRADLKKSNIKYYKITRKRYLITYFLHVLGVDYERLQKLKKYKLGGSKNE